MRFNKNIGFLLLAVWLILTGLSAFMSLGGLSVILALLAIAYRSRNLHFAGPLDHLSSGISDRVTPGLLKRSPLAFLEYPGLDRILAA